MCLLGFGIEQPEAKRGLQSKGSKPAYDLASRALLRNEEQQRGRTYKIPRHPRLTGSHLQDGPFVFEIGVGEPLDGTNDLCLVLPFENNTIPPKILNEDVPLRRSSSEGAQGKLTEEVPACARSRMLGLRWRQSRRP